MTTSSATQTWTPRPYTISLWSLGTPNGFTSSSPLMHAQELTSHIVRRPTSAVWLKPFPRIRFLRIHLTARRRLLSAVTGNVCTTSPILFPWDSCWFTARTRHCVTLKQISEKSQRHMLIETHTKGFLNLRALLQLAANHILDKL